MREINHCTYVGGGWKMARDEGFLLLCESFVFVVIHCVLGAGFSLGLGAGLLLSMSMTSLSSLTLAFALLLFPSSSKSSFIGF